MCVYVRKIIMNILIIKSLPELRPHQPARFPSRSRMAGRFHQTRVHSRIPIISHSGFFPYGRYSLVAERLAGFNHVRLRANTNTAHPPQDYSYSITAISSARQFES